MKIENQNQISFGQVVPTEALLKSALGIHKFEDAKILNQSMGIKYSGHVSFYKRAITISENILSKNPEIKDLIQKLKSESSLEQQLKSIKLAVKNIGENIDVVV